MKNSQTNNYANIALISAPWSLFSRPSIQLGVLKAYLQSHCPETNVASYHFYLKVAETLGYNIYHVMSERTWLAETIYASLLYPERNNKIEKLFKKEINNEPKIRHIEFNNLVSKVKKVTDKFIDDTDWSIFRLAGFTICNCQLTSSLYMIKQIKKRVPGIIIVAGGSTFTGISANIMQIFPEIDFIVNGEGEIPLSQLVEHLRAYKNVNDIPTIPGIISKKDPKNYVASPNQLKILDKLPVPDFDDYFKLLKNLSPQKSFFPTLPYEMSRGCWWQQKKNIENFRGCAFCNLNLQWKGYRAKNPVLVISEIEQLTSKYQTLSVAFTDNALPVKESREVFNKIKKLKKDLRFFAEIRATTSLETLKAMRTAGINEVQIGIEALSTGLLKKLNKGTTAIQNLEIMRNCEALGIKNVSNLILQFPGSDSEDVKETLRNLEFAAPFRPLRSVNFWLGLQSPVWNNPGIFKIKATYNHQNYSAIFPSEVYKSIRFTIQAYRGDLSYQRKLWKTVKKKIKDWKKEYKEIHKGAFDEPILSFRDGGDFIIITQKRYNSEPLTHRLKGPSREIYLFCLHNRPLQDILKHFNKINADQIISFLRTMISKKLMFEENDFYLSLAAPINFYHY